MTLTVTLDSETEKVIERKAARLGITPSEYLTRLAEKSARQRPGISKSAPNSHKKPRTGAELLAELDAAGLLNGYGDPNIDSPELARQLREQAQTRDWS